MSPEVSDLISALFGALVSVLLVVVPSVKEWWATQKYQREITLGFFLLAPFAVYGIACGGLDFPQVTCPADAFRSVQFYYDALKTGISAFVGSQLAYTGIKRVQNP